MNGRDRLIEALLDELLSWNPREFIVAFRRWHHDAFSLIHLNVLTMLEMDGSASMSHLAEALGVSVASMTGIVDRMEKRGLVERRRDGADRRVVLVYPTEAGRNIFREIDRRRRESLLKMLQQLGDEELGDLLAGHRALRGARAAAIALAGASTTAPNGDAPVAVRGATAPASRKGKNPPEIHRPSTPSPDDLAVSNKRRRRA